MVDILIGLVFVFIICNTPLIAFTIYEVLSSLISKDNSIMYDGWAATAVQLINLLVSASHALNIFVFCCQVLFLTCFLSSVKSFMFNFFRTKCSELCSSAKGLRFLEMYASHNSKHQRG